MNRDSVIFVAGHNGLVGSALTRKLRAFGFHRLLLRTRKELDLTQQAQVSDFFERNSVDYIFLAAGKVGGILANQSFPVEFLYENTMIALNVMNAAAKSGAKKLLYLGSSCIYPRETSQPILESSLLTGRLEPTNEAYALAKIAGLKLAEYYHKQYGKNFISAMPTNLYGPGDNFRSENAHVIPCLLRRFHEAKIRHADEVVVWGSGKAYRDFLFVDDLAEALLLLMKKYDDAETINIGSTTELSIRRLAETIRGVVGYTGKIVFDETKPDGMPRKILNAHRINALGWNPTHSLEQGLHLTYKWAVARGVLGSPSLGRKHAKSKNPVTLGTNFPIGRRDLENTMLGNNKPA